MKKMIPVFAVILMFAACKKSELPAPVTDNSSIAANLTDLDEINYAPIVIGTQKWMNKNLTTGRYRNGDLIPQVKNAAKWTELTTGAWCWYNNDSANGAVYGKLYNWYAVTDPRGLAPKGWHVPSDDEWTTLFTVLGNNAGGKMKETGTTHWLSPNTHATNRSGFTALPGGYCSGFYGNFNHIGLYGNWWSSTQSDNGYPWHYYGITLITKLSGSTI